MRPDHRDALIEAIEIERTTKVKHRNLRKKAGRVSGHLAFARICQRQPTPVGVMQQGLCGLERRHRPDARRCSGSRVGQDIYAAERRGFLDSLRRWSGHDVKFIDMPTHAIPHAVPQADMVDAVGLEAEVPSVGENEGCASCGLVDRTDVVRKKGGTRLDERSGDRGFPGSASTTEQKGPAVMDYRRGVEKHPSALVQNGSHGRARYEDRNVLWNYVRRRVQGQSAPFFREKPPDPGQIEQKALPVDGPVCTTMRKVGQARRNFSELDQHIGWTWVIGGKGGQHGKFDFGLHSQARQTEATGGRAITIRHQLWMRERACKGKLSVERVFE